MSTIQVSGFCKIVEEKKYPVNQFKGFLGASYTLSSNIT